MQLSGNVCLCGLAINLHVYCHVSCHQLLSIAALCTQVLLAATASPYLIALGAAAAGVCPLPALLSLALSLPAAKTLVDYAVANHTVPAQIAPLKKYGLKWHMAVAACLATGLAACRVL